METPEAEARGDASRTLDRAIPLLLILALSLIGIFDHDLWTPDEPRAAEIAREFLEPGHGWAVPTLNREPFLEKPPLVYWSAALSMKLFGVNAPAARLPCVFFGWGTLIFTFLLARVMFGEETARIAALILATSAGFLLVGHHLESDAGLTCFTAGGAYFLYRALLGSARWYAAVTACLLGAFFSKGFIGLAFLGLLFAGRVVWTRSWREILRARPWLTLPALAAPIALWLYLISRDPREDLLRVFLVDNHFGRFSGSSAALGHQRPFYYYVLQLPLQFAPWIPAVLFWRPKLKESADRFLLLWGIPGLLLLTLSSTKRGIYLIPLLAPLAILTAREMVLRGKGRWTTGLAVGIAAILLLASFVAVPRIDARKSLRPACLALPPGARILAVDPDETMRAVVPFYTGRYLVSVTESSLESVAGSDIAVLLGPGSSPAQRERLRKLFPQLRWGSPANASRGLWIYAR